MKLTANPKPRKGITINQAITLLQIKKHDNTTNHKPQRKCNITVGLLQNILQTNRIKRRFKSTYK